MVSSGLDYILGFQRHKSTVGVSDKGSNHGEGKGKTSITISIRMSTSKENLSISLTLLASITSRIVDIGLSYRVDKTGVESIVGQRKSSIRIGRKPIPVRKHLRGTKGNTQEGENSKTLHVK